MMESVDKLRNYGHDCCARIDDAIHDYCDEIEAEIAETEAFCRRVEEAARNNDELDVFGVAYIPLPVDADGVPIRVGDKLEFGENRNQGIVKALNEHMVIAIHVDDDYTNYAKYGLLWNADACRHVKPRTLEDVLEEYYDKRGWDEVDNCALNADELTAKYADEIRELLGGDAE